MSTYSRRDWLRTTGGAVSAAALARRASAKQKKSPDLNVLFIAVDDLRPSLGCHGVPNARTPHLDALAAEGMIFNRTYCQQAVCSPSRTSLLTGLRPDSTRVYDLETHFRRYRPNAVTLPQHFMKHGYVTAAFSKIYHKPAMDDYPSWSVASWIPASHRWDSPESRAFTARKWRELRESGWRSNERFYYEPSKRKPRVEGQRGWDMPSWESRAVPDHALPDGMTADAVIGALDQLKGRRFFLAAGFLKPHLPFVAPEKYYDLHPESEIEPAEFTDAPADAPPYALHNSGEMRGYLDIPQQGPIGEKKARELIRGYRASVSYVDAQIGRVVNALDRLGLRERTVIVLWGDHGYHLGDHGLWNKHSNFEAATRSPLIVSAPGRLNKGKTTEGLTEFVDIYPSLCELCDLPRPDGLEGSSFVPLIDDPERLWKRAAFSQYPRQIPGVGRGMGQSMRTRRYRYTEWRADDAPFQAAELYDYETDPHETANIANRPQNLSLVNGLSGMLRDGWRSSLPPTEGPE